MTVEHQERDAASGRLLSIDALRGFDMFWIIGGGACFESLADIWKHPVTEAIRLQLTHVEWEGFHFEDLIFPLFLFLAGVVLPLSLSRRRERGEDTRRLHLHVVRRTAILLLLGLILNGVLDLNWPEMRWPGVLQRIALCYLLAALVLLHARWRTQAILVAAILLLYWGVTMLVAAPGSAAGDLTMQGCLSSWIDQRLIPGALYYKFGDNEGMISTLPAVCTALLGALAGQWLQSDRTGSRKAAGLALAGIAGVTAGYLWGLVFPIIKILWTSSYVLFTGGWSLLLLAGFYWVIDVVGYRRWAFFFFVIGTNAITIYVLQDVVDFGAFSRLFLSGVAHRASLLAPLLLPLGALAARWLFLWFLYRRRIFFKV